MQAHRIGGDNVTLCLLCPWNGGENENVNEREKKKDITTTTMRLERVRIGQLLVEKREKRATCLRKKERYKVYGPEEANDVYSGGDKNLSRVKRLRGESGEELRWAVKAR